MVRTRIAAAALAVVTAVPLLAQAPAAAPEAGQTAAQHYKNIQVLKDIPAEELIPAMRFIESALGVECEFCHAGTNSPEDRAKDDKKEKGTARDMMKMMKQINDTSFEGRTEVTCATCHNGHSRPQAFGPMATVESVKERVAAEPPRPPQGQQQPAAQAPPAPPAFPAADQLFAKYEEAIGGDAAIGKLTTRHVVATVTSATGQTGKLEAFTKAPDLAWQQTSNARFSRTTGYDGKQAWEVARTTRPLTGVDAEDVKLAATFQRNLRLKDQYGQARTFHKGRIGDKDVYAVRAAIKGGRYSDVLYFDVNSGLLVRRVTFTRTVLGPIALTTDFDNYQDYNGVKVATDLTQSTASNVSKIHLDQVQFNVPIEDAKFAMPAQQQPPAK